MTSSWPIFIQVISFVAYHSSMEIIMEKTKIVRISKQPSSEKLMIDQKTTADVECLNYLAIITTDNARCSLHVKLNPAF